MTKKVLITGASGFIGQVLVKRLQQEPLELCYAVRNTQRNKELENVVFRGDFTASTNWRDALHNVDIVIHLAARAHVLKETKESAETEFMQTNYLATKNLAEQCAGAGVKKFIFMSSIGVSVRNTSSTPINENSQCGDVELYAKSKQLAERDVSALCAKAGMDLIIVRPPLVYGAHAPGNFARLVKLAKLPLPLPLGLACNKRNFVSISNLVDFINHCVRIEQPVNEAFVVADDETISTNTLISCLREGMGRSPWLVPFPPSAFRLLVTLMGKPQFFEQLFCDLQVDNTKAKTILGWSPPFNTYEELKRCGASSNLKHVN